MPDEIEFPEVRERVMEAVEALAKPYRPGESASASLSGGASQFGEIFDLLYESVDLVDEPLTAIGAFLKSEEEARALSQLTALLLTVVEETEQYANDFDFPTDDEYQRADTWPKVVESARRARSVMVR